MSDQLNNIREYISRIELQDYLDRIELQDYIPDRIDGAQLVEEFRVIAHYDHPKFPVFVCCIFILTLLVIIVILRYICKQLDAKESTPKREEKIVEIKSNQSKAQEVEPKPKPRWKKPVVVEPKENAKKLTGLKPRETPRSPPSPTPQNSKAKAATITAPEGKKPWNIKDAIATSNKAVSPKSKDAVAPKSPKPEVKKNSFWNKKEEVDTKKEDEKPKSLEVQEEKRSWSPFAKKSSPMPEPAKSSKDEKSPEKEQTEEKGWFWQKSASPAAAAAPSPEKDIASTDIEEEKLDEVKPARVFNLKIDKNARNPEETKKARQTEIDLLRTMGKEFRELIKLDESGVEEREEKKKDMEKVKSARTYFHEVEKQRSQAGTPVNKFRVDEENLEGTGLSVGDMNLVQRRSTFYQSKQHASRLSQFEPGKLNKTSTSKFENGDNGGQERIRAPKKKLITLDQVMKKQETDEEDGILKREDERNRREIEIQQLREARQQWVPPEEPVQAKPQAKEVIPVEAGSVKKRWLNVQERPERPRSADIPGRISVNLFEERAEEEIKNKEVDAELNEIRDSRPTPVTKRWRHERKVDKESRAVRSRSAHVLKKADDSWVLDESSKTRLEEEKRKAQMELELVKRVRLQAEEENIYDFTTLRAEERRKENIMELEAVKSLRKTQAADFDCDTKEDPREARKRELENLMKLRATGQEFSVESTPRSATLTATTPKHVTIKEPNKMQEEHQEKDRGKSAERKSDLAKVGKMFTNVVKRDKSSERKEVENEEKRRSTEIMSDFSKVGRKISGAIKRDKSSERKEGEGKSESSLLKSKSDELSKKFVESVSKTQEEAKNLIINSEVAKLFIGSEGKSESKHASNKISRSPSFKELRTATEMLEAQGIELAKTETPKISKSSSSEVNKKSKVVKSSSSESHKKEVKNNTRKEVSIDSKSTKIEVKNKNMANGDTSELKTETAIYSEVDKSKKKAKQAEAKQEKEVKEVKQVVTVKVSEKKEATKSEVNFNNLSGYKIDKCDLKAKDSSMKVLPSKVVNCTPRPFTPAMPSNIPAFVPSPQPEVVPTHQPAFVPNSKPAFTPAVKPAYKESQKEQESNKAKPKSKTEPDAQQTEEKSNLAKAGKMMSNIVKRDKSTERKEVDSTDEATRPKAASPARPAAKFFKSLMPEEAAEPTDVEKEKKSSGALSMKQLKEILMDTSDGAKNGDEEPKEETKKSMTDAAETISKAKENVGKAAENMGKAVDDKIKVLSNKFKGAYESKLKANDDKDDGNDKPTVEEADSKKPEADQRSESASLELKENRLSVRFKEIKEKTVTEVTKQINRGRSLHRKETRGEDEDNEDGDTASARTRSESRSQKAGRKMREFTSNILKKR